MKRIAAICIGVMLSVIVAMAQDKPGRFEVSVGWADQSAEALVWHEKAEPIGLMPEDYIINANQDYHYTQHWFVEGRYKALDWLSVGAMFDWSGVTWDYVSYTGTGRELSRENKNFYNYIFMPTVRFNWFRREHIQLYSGLGAGLLINTGTETDYLGRTTALAPVFSLNTIGVRGDYDRFFAAVDFGASLSMTDANTVYFIGSKLISISIGIKL